VLDGDVALETAGKLKCEQESAMNFMQTVVGREKDRVLFATFDDQITLPTRFHGPHRVLTGRVLP